MANIIDVLLSNRDEEKYHSRVLTWLVDPRFNHKLGRIFFDALLQCAFPDWNFGEVLQARGEYYLDSSNTVDVGVLADTQFLMIENKTRFSSITEGQVERYIEVARQNAVGKEVRLIYLLPGPRRDFAQLRKRHVEIAVIFWSQIAEILRLCISLGTVSKDGLPALQMYLDYITRSIALGGATVALPSTHPRMSLSRSGSTSSFGASRAEYLAEASVKCAEHPERLDLIHGFIGFLENLSLLRVQYRQGKTHWSVSGGIPRADGGVNCLVGCYATGRIWYEFARVPLELGEEYRRLTFNDSAKSWREVWIETLPLEKTMNAIRTVATKAVMNELPIGMLPQPEQ